MLIYNIFSVIIQSYKCTDNFCSVDLRKLLLFCTGSEDVLCNHITVQFTNDELAPAVKANTCSRELTFSLNTSPPSALVEALKAIINGDDKHTYTML